MSMLKNLSIAAALLLTSFISVQAQTVTVDGKIEFPARITLPEGSGTGGTQGPAGKSAYQSWLDQGNTGTEAQFIQSLKGTKGDTGAQGVAGATGATGTQGPQGIQGIPGPQGPQGPAGSGSGGGNGLPVITTQAAFVSAVQSALDACRVAQFGEGSAFTATSKMTFTLKDCAHYATGFDGHGLRIDSSINDGGGVMVFKTGSQGPNRSLIIQGFSIYGDQYAGKDSGTCLTLTALRNTAIYKFTIRDVWIDYCSGHGLALVGDVFEGSVYNAQVENNGGSGIYMNHGADCGIVSNVFLIAPNMSRNKRYGMELDERSGCGAVSSVHAQFPSMVSNAIGGILAKGGIRNIFGGNCENTGLVCVDVLSSPYQTRIAGMEMSTDNSTNAGVNGSQAAKYLWRYPSGADQSKAKQVDGSVACYGSNCSGVQVRAP